MITPQTNTTIEVIAHAVASHGSFAICGHVNPDGDCIGSQLALAHALKRLGKSVSCLLAKPNSVPHNLEFLPGIDGFVAACDYEATPECFIGVDVPTEERLGDAAAVLKRCSSSITIDHHANETTYAQLVYVDPDSPSASMLVWKLVCSLEAQNADSALCALTGVFTDTGRFSHQNTTADAFLAAADMVKHGGEPNKIARGFFQCRRMQSLRLEQVMFSHLTLSEDGAFAYSWLTNDDFASCDAVKADAESFIDSIRDIDGVRVALILKENDEGSIRGSLRAKDETDVAKVARRFDGGGHKAAAGLTFRGTLAEALEEVPAAVVELCFDERA